MITKMRAFQRWATGRPWLMDVTLGGGLTAFDVLTLMNRRPPSSTWGVALWGLQTVPLFWRRRHPHAVLAAMTGAYVLFQVVGPVPEKVPGPFLLMFGVYAVARYAPVSGSLPGTLLCLVAAMTADLLTGHWQSPH